MPAGPKNKAEEPKKWALDLFCGRTHSVGNRLKQLGYHVVSLDIEPKANPDICINILHWDYWNHYKSRKFEVVTASVPCQEYSQAKTTGIRDIQYSDRLVRCVRKLIEYFQPKFWWIENPRSGLLKEREVLEKVPYIDIDYCQFCRWGYKKPTRFWACKAIAALPSVTCDPATCPNTFEDDSGVRKHRYSLGGNHLKFNEADKGRIPPLVVDYLLQQGEYHPETGRYAQKCREWREAANRGEEEAPRDEPASGKRHQSSTLRGGCCDPEPPESTELEASYHHNVRRIKTKPAWKNRVQFKVGEMYSVSKDTQLVMAIPCQVADDCRLARILIDTGAEANLVRKDFLPPEYM